MVGLRAILGSSLCLLILAGCTGKKGVTVQGKVVLPPAVKLEESDVVSITFTPEGVKDKGAGAQASPKDLSFAAKGVFPGKNRIGVKITPYMGSPGSEKRSEALAPLNNMFGANNDKLTYEVTRDSTQSITIDLTKGTVTK
jgi:hypothetical protein